MFKSILKVITNKVFIYNLTYIIKALLDSKAKKDKYDAINKASTGVLKDLFINEVKNKEIEVEYKGVKLSLNNGSKITK